MLNATLQHQQEQFNTPVSEDIQENLYVDNLKSGCESETQQSVITKKHILSWPKANSIYVRRGQATASNSAPG
jgi:hypothetical protein